MVVVGAALVVDVVNFQVFSAAALSALVAVSVEDSFAGGGGDVFGAVCPRHRLFTAFWDRENPGRGGGVLSGVLFHTRAYHILGGCLSSRGGYLFTRCCLRR